MTFHITVLLRIFCVCNAAKVAAEYQQEISQARALTQAAKVLAEKIAHPAEMFPAFSVLGKAR